MLRIVLTDLRVVDYADHQNVRWVSRIDGCWRLNKQPAEQAGEEIGKGDWLLCNEIPEPVEVQSASIVNLHL